MSFHASSRNVSLPAAELLLPGIAERVGHKLAGYDWNLTEQTWCTFMVYEVHPRQLEQYAFAGSRGFTMQHRQSKPRTGRIIYQTRLLRRETLGARFLECSIGEENIGQRKSPRDAEAESSNGGVASIQLTVKVSDQTHIRFHFPTCKSNNQRLHKTKKLVECHNRDLI